MSPPLASHDSRGFTLIEVLGALMVFSLGVLMVMGQTGALSTALGTAALRSELAVTVQNRLDSLQAIPYDSLTVGSTSATVTIRGVSYRRTEAIFQTTPLVREVQVTLEPVSGEGPDLTSTGFVLWAW